MLKTCDLIKDVEDKYIEMLKMVNIPEFTKCMAQFSGIAIKDIKDNRIKSLLLTWAKNKYKFFQMLGNKTYIDIPFEYKHFKEDICREIEDISNKFPVYRPWLEGFEGMNTNKIDNTYNIIYEVKRLINRSFPNFNISGTTITHFFKSNLSAPDELITDLAAIFENQTVKATYTISIDPIDIMTASENPYDWRSCYRLETDGTNDSHADGCVAALLDESSLITYIWNNHGKYSMYGKYELKDIRYKRMREWIAISPSMTAIHFNKIYPGKDSYEKEFKAQYRSVVEDFVAKYINKNNMWKKSRQCRCVRRYGYGYDEFDEEYIYQLSECETPERWEVFTEYVPCLCCGDPLPPSHISGSEDPREDVEYEYSGYGFNCSEWSECEPEEEEYFCDYADDYCSHECYLEACEDCPHWQNAHPVCDLDEDVECEEDVDVYDGVAHSCARFCEDCPNWEEHHREAAANNSEEQEQEEEAVEWQVTSANYPQPSNPVTIDCPTLNIERAGANLFETITTRDGLLTLRATPYENHLEDSIRYWTTGRYNSGANGE